MCVFIIYVIMGISVKCGSNIPTFGLIEKTILKSEITHTSTLSPQLLSGGKQNEDTLHYDGDNVNSIGLTEGGIFYAGVRFTPLTAGNLIAVMFYHNTGANAGNVHIYGAGTDTTPGTELTSEAYSAPAGNDWKIIELSPPVEYSAGVDLWTVVEITHSAGSYPLGVAAGPMVRNRGCFISMEGDTWYQLKDLNSALDYNWNIRAIVEPVALAHDVAPIAYTNPPSAVKVGTAYPVSFTVKNKGTSAEVVFIAGCTILTASLATEYTDTVTVTGLAAGATQVVNLKDWTPALYDHNYTVVFGTVLPIDMVPQNDTLVMRYARTYEEGELAYDDFVAEGYMWVGGDQSDTLNIRNGANDVFAVRFTPVETPPFYVTKGKVYAYADTSIYNAFEYIGLFPGTESAPDINSPYDTIQNLSLSAPGWIWVHFDTSKTHIATSDPLWLVAKFVEGQKGPLIGVDKTAPIDGNSCWTSDMTQWNAVMDCDFMMRIIHNKTGNVEETPAQPKFSLSHLRNPVRSNFSIEYTVPAKTNVSINLYDITGRLALILENGMLNKGSYRKEVNTANLRTGIYFLKAQDGKSVITQKLILLK